jgi:hypothetical protein
MQFGMDSPLRNEGGQTIFWKDQEDLLVTRILKCYACGFEMDSNDVRRVSFPFAEQNTIKYNFTVNKKWQVSTGSKDFVGEIQ